LLADRDVEQLAPSGLERLAVAEELERALVVAAVPRFTRLLEQVVCRRRRIRRLSARSPGREQRQSEREKPGPAAHSVASSFSLSGAGGCRWVWGRRGVQPRRWGTVSASAAGPPQEEAGGLERAP